MKTCVCNYCGDETTKNRGIYDRIGDKVYCTTECFQDDKGGVEEPTLEEYAKIKLMEDTRWYE